VGTASYRYPNYFENVICLILHTKLITFEGGSSFTDKVAIKVHSPLNVCSLNALKSFLKERISISRLIIFNINLIIKQNYRMAQKTWKRQQSIFAVKQTDSFNQSVSGWSKMFNFNVHTRIMHKYIHICWVIKIKGLKQCAGRFLLLLRLCTYLTPTR